MEKNQNRGERPVLPNRLLQAERMRRGWSQKDLADLLNVPDARNIGRWERGETFPHPHYRRELCRVFGKSMEELGLLTRTAEPEKPQVPPGQQEMAPLWNVPCSFPPCLGRAQEIAEICALLERSDLRLLSVLGPGGIGKTRIVEEVAQQVRGRFAAGVCFVALRAVGDASLVLPTLAQELHIQESGNETLLARVNSALQGRPLLLILDGFERVGEAAPLIGQVLAACAEVRVLVTSQVPVHLSAEQEFPLGPLALPPRDLLAWPERLVSYASLALFAQQAQVFLPAFRLTRENARTIAEICLHLDGLPLAIELAAANLKMFAPRALLAQIVQQPFKVLVDERGSATARSSTLYGTIKWSYDLLKPQEQWLFRHLAVFADGCSLEAIEGLCQLYPQGTLDVLALTRSLIDRSLLQHNAREGVSPSFTMLETLHAFGIDCLRRNGEWEESQQAHADYYLALVEEAGPHLRGAAQAEWLERLEGEKENLRAALNWLLSEQQTEQALCLSEVFGKFCGLRGYWSEEDHWLQMVLQQADKTVPSRTLGRVLRRAGHLAYRFRNLSSARQFLEQSVALSQQLGDLSNLAGALSGLGWVLYRQKKVAKARQLLRKSREVARSSGDTWALANTQESLGRFLHVQGQLDEARDLVAEGVALARSLADKENLARLLCTLVAVEISLGEMEQAEAFAWESYTLACDTGNTPLIALTLDGLARVVFCQEEFDAARELYERRLELARQLDDRSALAGSKLKLSDIALKQGNVDLGGILVEESLEFLRQRGDDPNIAVALCILGDVRRTRRHFAQAIPAYQQALRLEQEIGEKETIGRSLIGLARVLLEQDQAEVATRLLGFACITLGPADTIPYLTLATDYQRTLEQAYARLGAEQGAGAWAGGSTLSYGAMLALCDQYSNGRGNQEKHLSKS
ncbi:MAG TPA: tetratricopeptide repeat protein [Ktedonobacteraceae bacterium]